MSITYGDAKKILSRYVGTGGACANNTNVDLFVREVLDYLLISGHFGNIQKFSFCAVDGCITIPYELETPLKIKIDNEIATVWDRWFEFHQTKVLEGCMPAANALVEDPNYYPTIYNLPSEGATVGVMATCDEEDGAHIIVKGEDTTGREIVTMHNGEQIVGAYLSLCKGIIKTTAMVFGKITAIVKPKTKGYTTLYWVKPTTKAKGYLADYSPLETAPAYRRFRLTQSCPKKAKISILGRIRLKAAYADNDYIPFDNIYTLNLAGQAVNANYNGSPDIANAKDKMLVDIVERDNNHHKINNGSPMEFFLLTSPGAIKNII